MKTKMRKNKKLAAVIGAALVLCLIAAGIITMSANDADRRLTKELELGQKYLDELDYEQAIVAYKTAIEIDPMSIEAYLGLAEVYEDMGNNHATAMTSEEGYVNCLEVYDRLLEFAADDKWVLDRLGNCLEQYLNFLLVDERYDEIRTLNEKYGDYVTGVDFQLLLEELSAKEITVREARVEIYRVFEDGRKFPMEEYENTYDEDGHRIRSTGRTTISAPDAYWHNEWYDEYFYDEEDNLIRTDCYGGDRLYYHYENEFDENGRCVKESFYNHMTGQSDLERCNEKTYDSLGQLISEDIKYYYEDVVRGYGRMDYVYDEMGRCIWKNYSYHSDGGQAGDYSWEAYDYSWNKSFEYDEYNRCVREGGDNNNIEYKYDIEGNRIGKTWYWEYGGLLYEQTDYIWEEGKYIEPKAKLNEYGEYSNRYSGGG